MGCSPARRRPRLRNDGEALASEDVVAGVGAFCLPIQLRGARGRGALPGMDGFKLVERIRQMPELSTATIMMLTSSESRGDAERCKSLGVSAYLPKPIRLSELREAIARVVGTREHKSEIPPVTLYSVKDPQAPILAQELDDISNPFAGRGAAIVK